jgi:DNA-binding protein HU-beta
MIVEKDEFEKHARTKLGNNPQLLDQLLVLRKEVQQEGAKAWSKSKIPTASELNAANRNMIARAASLLGPAEFEQVFGFAPNEKFSLVDSRMTQSEAEVRRTKEPAENLPSRGAAAAFMKRRMSPSAERELPTKHIKTATPMTKVQLIENIYKNTELSKKDVRAVLETLTDIGHKELRKTSVFLVPGFAKFVVVKKPATKARKGTNPFTGESMVFKAKPARKIVRVVPVKTTKDAV